MKFRLVIAFLILVYNSSAQLLLQSEIKIEHDYFEIDHLKNLYFVHHNVLTKIAQDGSRKKQYSDDHQNAISHIDVVDPMNVLVFSAENNRLVFLDNNLSERQTAIYLEDFDISDSSLVAQSSNYWFWMYQPYNATFVAIDRNSNIGPSTKDITILSGSNSSPCLVLEYANQLFVHIPTLGLLVFDSYGAYIRTINLPHLAQHSIQFSANQIHFVYNNNLQSIHLQTGEKIETIIEASYKQLRFIDGVYYCSDGKHLIQMRKQP